MSVGRLVVASFVLALCACGGGRTPLESAVLTSDWARILADTPDRARRPPEETLLQAHASLALNRGNDAACLLGALSDADLLGWDNWTRDLVRAHAHSSIVHYLRADALARAGWVDQALSEADEAVNLDSTSAMALHARGVLRGVSGDLEGSETDLRRAAILEPAFAAAIVSRGFADLDARKADSALSAFDAALKITPNYALAVGGKLYTATVMGRQARDVEDLSKSIGSDACGAAAVVRPMVELVAWISQTFVGSGESLDGAPGTQMDIELGRLGNHDLSAIGRIDRLLGQNPDHPELSFQLKNTLDRIGKTDPSYLSAIKDQSTKNTDWIKPDGGAITTLSALKGLDVGLQFGKGPITPRVGWSASGVATEQIDKTKIDYQGGQIFNQLLNNKPSGGVEISLAQAELDRGDWPTPHLNALLYPYGGGR